MRNQNKWNFNFNLKSLDEIFCISIFGAQKWVCTAWWTRFYLLEWATFKNAMTENRFTFFFWKWLKRINDLKDRAYMETISGIFPHPTFSLNLFFFISWQKICVRKKNRRKKKFSIKTCVPISFFNNSSKVAFHSSWQMRALILLFAEKFRFLFLTNIVKGNYQF